MQGKQKMLFCSRRIFYSVEKLSISTVLFLFFFPICKRLLFKIMVFCKNWMNKQTPDDGNLILPFLYV